MKDESKLNDLCEIKNTLIAALSSEINGDLKSVNTHEAGAVIDMIKDICEAERNYRESCYYKAVTDAMEEKSLESERYGYRMPEKRSYRPYMDQEPYVDEYLSNPEFSENMRRVGYTPTTHVNGTGDRYGKSYREYQMSKRHYTDTNSARDKEEMNMHASEHMTDTILTIRDIYRNSDPDLKKRIKTDLSGLISEMSG